MNRTLAISARLLATTLAFAATAPAGQLSHTQLLGFMSDRPLHDRVSAADVAVIGRIESVGVGRIGVRNAEVLFGEADPSFEIKRSPLHPPALMVGERALLILSGARSPYLLIERDEDLVKMIGDTMEARWAQAIRDLHAALEKPDDMTSNYLAWVYLEWLAQPAHDLKRAAVAGFADRRAQFHPLAASFVRALIDTASDPATDFDVRRGAAFVAGRSSAEQPELAALDPRIQQALEALDTELRD